MVSRGDQNNNELIFQSALKDIWLDGILPFLKSKDVWQVAHTCKDARKLALKRLAKLASHRSLVSYKSLVRDAETFDSLIRKERKTKYQTYAEILFGHEQGNLEQSMLIQFPRYASLFTAIMGVMFYSEAERNARKYPLDVRLQNQLENIPVVMELFVLMFLVLSLIMIIINLCRQYHEIANSNRAIARYQQKKARVTHVASVLFPERRKNCITKFISSCCRKRK